MNEQRLWWQDGVIYQVYPRSLQDTNADGVGDLRGIHARLDYFVALGVDALWISPIYPSPMADFGYDVADYTGIATLFGSMADFDALLAATHERGLKLILDFIPNHSSDQHPWFVESRSSRDNPKRDWYLWHDAVPYAWLAQGEDTRPISEQYPNNWMSHFGGPAWTWDETTQQFYLHSFLAQQPDLNWRNPQVKQAMFDAMRFWLAKGVDGFRMDVLWLLIKDAEFRNNPPNPAYHGDMQDIAANLPVYTADQPETHTIVAEMRALMDSYAALDARVPPATNCHPDPEPREGEGYASAPAHSFGSPRVLIGEIYLPLPELVRYYGLPPEHAADSPEAPALNGANLPFNFALIQTPWNADAIANVITTYESLLPPGAWPNYVLGNHDQSRLATRIGLAQARVAQMLLLTLRGTPTMYYGDELAMQDVPIAPDQVRDPAELNEPGKGRGRDPERSPMLWTSAANAGFTAATATPWLPIAADYQTRNVTAQGIDPRSMLSLTRALLHLRRQLPALHFGSIISVRSQDGVLSYVRNSSEPSPLGPGPSSLQIHLNLTTEERTLPTQPGTIFFTTLMDGAGAEVQDTITLEANEGVILELS